MKLTLAAGFVSLTLLAVLLVWLRARVGMSMSRLTRAEEQALALEPDEEEA